MDEVSKVILDLYLKNIVSFYALIEKWLAEKNLTFKKSEHTIHEKASGTYKTEKLIILFKNNTQIAELLPIGAWTIGAQGRVDLIGDYDQQILVYLTPEFAEGASSEQLYKGVEKNGWYWVEEKRRNRAHLVDQELFFDLLDEVTDNAF